MTKPKPERTVLDDIFDNLIEAGLPIEAGWATLADSVLPEDASPEIVATHRAAFFAGATYLISRQMAAAHEAGSKAGEKLLTDVHKELAAFTKQMAEAACPQTVTIFRRDAERLIGPLPSFLDPADPRPAREQFDANYRFGGWRPIKGFTCDWKKDGTIRYPGDPPLRPIAGMHHHREMVMFYDQAFVAVIQPDGTYEVARMD